MAHCDAGANDGGVHLITHTPPPHIGQDIRFYRKINQMNPRNQLVNVDYGNDAVDSWSYGPANGQMSAMVSAVPGLTDQLADLGYDYDEFGNLVFQDNQLLGVRETFFYDQLQRLSPRALTEPPRLKG